MNYHCVLATLLDPDGTCSSSRYRVGIAVCCERKHIDFRTLLLTGLNCFTLTHCSSHTPLPTLKPNLAASAPRLCTGCSLDFTGAGLSPTYISSAELAHSFRWNFSNDFQSRTCHTLSSLKKTGQTHLSPQKFRFVKNTTIYSYSIIPSKQLFSNIIDDALFTRRIKSAY